MRPFRFFFFLVMGGIFFFFIARLLFVFLAIAAVMGLGMMAFRAFHRLRAYQSPAHLPESTSPWWLPESADSHPSGAEPLFQEKAPAYDWLTDSRRIEVQ